MTERQRAVGIFNNSLNTEAALKELDRSHYSLDRVFVIANNTRKESEIVDTQLCESLRDRFNASISNVANGYSSNIEGRTEISLSEALIHLDIPVDMARLYDDFVAQGKYLVMVEGSHEDISGAKTILKRSGIQDWVVYKIALEHPEVIIVDRREVS